MEFVPFTALRNIVKTGLPNPLRPQTRLVLWYSIGYQLYKTQRKRKNKGHGRWAPKQWVTAMGIADDKALRRRSSLVQIRSI